MRRSSCARINVRRNIAILNKAAAGMLTANGATHVALCSTPDGEIALRPIAIEGVLTVVKILDYASAGKGGSRLQLTKQVANVADGYYDLEWEEVGAAVLKRVDSNVVAAAAA